MTTTHPSPLVEGPYLLLGAQDQCLGAEQGQLPCGCTGTCLGNCQETETYMVQACHMPQQTPKPSFRAPWRWVMPWSAEEMLDGQCQRVDIPAHAKAAHKGLLQKTLEDNLCLNHPLCPPSDATCQGT